jgi:KDO2-lipid IV(A) lauroyltransferase
LPTQETTRLKHRLEASAARGAGAIFQLMPLWLCACAAWALGSLAALIDKRHRLQMIRQMRLAFGPELSEKEANRLAWRCYRHEILAFIELARVPAMSPEKTLAIVDVSELEPIRDLLKSGQGALAISGHFGSWELSAHASGCAGLPATYLARPLKNELLDRHLNRLREISGNRILNKANSIREIGKLLGQGKYVGLIYDQNGGPGDAFIPFFGIPAATWRSASFLHWKYKTPIVVGTCSREDWKGARHTVKLRRVLMPVEGEGREESEQRVLGEINMAFEEAIREYPEQWVWQHRRWKTRPPGENSRLIDGIPEFDDVFKADFGVPAP